MFKTKKWLSIFSLAALSALCFLLALGLFGLSPKTANAADLPQRTVGRHVSVDATDLVYGAVNSTDNRNANGVLIGYGGYNLYPGKDNYAAAIAYTIPADSTTTSVGIASDFKLQYGDKDAVFGYRVLLNDRVIYPANGGWQTITTTAQKAYLPNVSVKGGDVIRFVAKADWNTYHYVGDFVYSSSYVNDGLGNTITGGELNFINPENALNEDGSAKTKTIFGGTYEYAQIQKYEQVVVTDLIKDSVGFTEAEFTQKFNAKPASWCGAPSYETENGENYVHFANGYSATEYNSTIKDYKMSTSFRWFDTDNNAIDFGVYFNCATDYMNSTSDGYILHFYQGSTVLYNVAKTNGWYDYSQYLAKFNKNYHDGEWHDLSITCLDNKYYIAIDNQILVADNIEYDGNNGEFDGTTYTGATAWEDTHIRFVGTSFDLKKFEIDYLSYDDAAAAAQYDANYALYQEYATYDLNEYEAMTAKMLNDEFDNGMANIFNATTKAEAESALATAKEAMSAVPKALGLTLVGYYVEGEGYNGLYGVDVDLTSTDITAYTPVYVKIEMEEGASVRISDPTGMRFITGVETAYLTALNDLGAQYSLGTYIVKAEDIMVNGELDYTKIPDVETKLDIPATATYQSGENTMFTGTLIEIKADHYDWDFAGVGYIKVSYNDGSDCVFYAKSTDNVRSIETVAHAAFNDFSDVQTDDYPYLTEYGYSAFNDTQRATLAKFFNGNQDLSAKTNPDFGAASIHVIDVCNVPEDNFFGGGSSILVLYGNTATLIDAGWGTYEGQDMIGSKTRIVNYLKSQGVQRLDNVIMTHPHHDHAGGLPYVIENFDVGTIYSKPLSDWSVGASGTDGEYQANYEAVINAGLNKINSDGIAVKFVEPTEEGQTFAIDETTYFKVFNCTDLYSDSTCLVDYNYLSQQYLFVSGTAKAFFGGDAAQPADKYIVGNVGEVDVFVLEHHGDSGAYNTEDIFTELKPDYSVAQGNMTQPKDATRTFAEQYGMAMNTGTDGTLVFNDIDGAFTFAKESDYLADAPTVTFANAPTVQSSTSGGTAISVNNNTHYFGYENRLISSTSNTYSAFVLTVPESFGQTAVLTIDGEAIKKQYDKTDSSKFCIIQNDKLVYGDNGGWVDVSNATSSNPYYINDFRIKVSGGDKIYFMFNTYDVNNQFNAPIGMYINGMYFNVVYADHLNADNDNVACTKNVFNGTLYNNGNVYTRAEILSYVTGNLSDITIG